MEMPEDAVVDGPNDKRILRILLLILLIAPPLIILFVGMSIAISGSNY